MCLGHWHRSSPVLRQRQSAMAYATKRYRDKSPPESLEAHRNEPSSATSCQRTARYDIFEALPHREHKINEPPHECDTLNMSVNISLLITSYGKCRRPRSFVIGSSYQWQLRRHATQSSSSWSNHALISCD